MTAAKIAVSAALDELRMFGAVDVRVLGHGQCYRVTGLACSTMMQGLSTSMCLRYRASRFAGKAAANGM
jgi:hypothetical protein